MHCAILSCSVLHCIVMRTAALCCNVLSCTALMHYSDVCCDVLENTVLYCTVLYCTETQCSYITHCAIRSCTLDGISCTWQLLPATLSCQFSSTRPLPFTTPPTLRRPTPALITTPHSTAQHCPAPYSTALHVLRTTICATHCRALYPAYSNSESRGLRGKTAVRISEYIQATHDPHQVQVLVRAVPSIYKHP
jgi:hypothetical protein